MTAQNAAQLRLRVTPDFYSKAKAGQPVPVITVPTNLRLAVGARYGCRIESERGENMVGRVQVAWIKPGAAGLPGTVGLQFQGAMTGPAEVTPTPKLQVRRAAGAPVLLSEALQSPMEAPPTRTPPPASTPPPTPVPKPQPAGAEKRTAPRLELQLEVGMESEHNFYTGLTQDISTGGLFVATDQQRKVGDRLMIAFTVPGVEPITAETEVRWMRDGRGGPDAPAGLGLRFLRMSPHGKKAITDFLKDRDSLFYDE